jgi:hypothetical protein
MDCVLISGINLVRRLLKVCAIGVASVQNIFSIVARLLSIYSTADLQDAHLFPSLGW